MSKDDLKQEFIDIGKAIAEASSDILSLAYQEDDNSTEEVQDAAHFIKLDGQRLGRDLELYGFMSSEFVVGPRGTLPFFFEEIVLPLKAVAPEAYKIACDMLKKVGKRVYSSDLQVDWEEILSK